MRFEVGQVVAEGPAGRFDRRRRRARDRRRRAGRPPRGVQERNSRRSLASAARRNVRRRAARAGAAGRRADAHLSRAAASPRRRARPAARRHRHARRRARRHAAAAAAIPASAITQANGQPAVWVVRRQGGEATGGTVELVQVAVHGYRNDEVLVSGLPAGELVVTAGVQKMAPGLRVALPRQPHRMTTTRPSRPPDEILQPHRMGAQPPRHRAVPDPRDRRGRHARLHAARPARGSELLRAVDDRHGRSGRAPRRSRSRTRCSTAWRRSSSSSTTSRRSKTFARQGYGGMTLSVYDGTSKKDQREAWYQARKKFSRHPERAARGRDRPDLQRRVRRRVGAAVRRQGRRHRPRRALRHGRGHQAAAC